MTNLKNYLLTLLLLFPLLAMAQEEKTYQAFQVHEDRVKPSMIEEYEQVSKDLIAACEEHDVQGLNWMTVAQDDNTYMYLKPMEKFAELDANPFSELSDKMGEEKMGALFSRFDPCYDEHGDYIIYLRESLSYQPGGINTNPEGKYYRKFLYDFVSPSGEKEYVAALKEIKAYFEEKNAKLHYRIYASGFGIMGKYYLIVMAGENSAEFEKLAAENCEDIKDGFSPLIKKIRSGILRSDEKTGWIRGDLSYQPKK